MTVAASPNRMDNSAQMIATRCPAVRWIALLSGLIALCAAPRAAHSCFFYEGAEDTPIVDQTAMQVVLRQQGDCIAPLTPEQPCQTRMILGARTEGFVPDLGWIVPVPHYPTVDVDATFSFVSLDAATAPTFRTSTGYGGSAYAESSGAGCGGAKAEDAGEGPPVDYPQVTVWDTTDAGPYTIVVLTAESLTALRTWASDNGFPWLPSTEPDFQHYIDERWFFVASKVRPAEGAPSLVPLSLTWEGGDLVVPLMMSRRDATTDMSLVVWVIADAPAKPAPGNWAQVAVPEASIVVDDYESNYADLVAETVDGAGGGRAFVTEYVQPAATAAFEINDEPTSALVGTTGWVTRLYTRVDPEDVTSDPTFVLDDAVAPVAQLHDLTLVEGPYWGAAFRPIASLAPVGLFVLARLLRRRRG